MMKTKQDFLVQGLENVEPAYAMFPGKMYAGTLPTSKIENGRVGEMMFWLFEPDTQTVQDSIVLWLNGGPGCSSFNCGVMMEHSPVTQPLHSAGYCCLKDSTPQLAYNEYTWTKATTMLYVEYPIGTGFSYGSPLPETESEAAGDLVVFLQNFYKVFDHLKPSNFFVFGESYAGMFVPSVSRRIHLANKDAIQKGDEDFFIVPLAGAALGNGWVDGKIQGPSVIDYSWYHGLIDKPTRDALHVEWENCIERLGSSKDVEPPPFHPFNVVDDCGMMWGVLQAAGNPNAYDISTWDPNVDQVTFTSEAFYNTAEVKAALHAPTNITWHGCRWGSGRRRLSGTTDRHHYHNQERRLYMDNDRPFDVSPYIAELLDEGIPVMVYNGDRDMTTNMVGTELILNKMEWKGKNDWLDAPRGLWQVDGYPAGWSKEHEGLTFAVIYNSGHMVPYNQPGPAYDLLTRFLTKKSMIDMELPKFRIKALSRSSSVSVSSSIGKKESVSIGTTEQSTWSKADLSSITGRGGSFAVGKQHETALVALFSMFVGFVLAMLVMRRGGGRGPSTRRSNNAGYQRVPDATM